MPMFTVIDGENVVLTSKGVFKQTKLYDRGGDVYAGFGSGFIRLYRSGMTSVPNVRYEDCELDNPEFDKRGRMTRK